MIKVGCRLVMGVVFFCLTMTGSGCNKSPSLEATLQFIADQIRTQESFNYDFYMKNEKSPISVKKKSSNVLANVKNCSISYDIYSEYLINIYQHIENTPRKYNHKSVVNFKDINYISAMTYTQAESNSENPTTRTDPEFYVVKMDVGKDSINPSYLEFHTEDTAKRVAKAMSHAVQLCGGKAPLF